MSLDLSKVKNDFNENNGYWFTYDEVDDVEIKIRPLFPDKADELTKKCTRLNVKGIKEINQEKLSDLTRDYIIEDWKGVIIDNQNAECNKENKTILAKYCGSLMKWIMQKSNEIADIIESQDEEKVKKLKSLLEI